jgi:nucleoside 2-deoxyribosyltransferase
MLKRYNEEMYRSGCQHSSHVLNAALRLQMTERLVVLMIPPLTATGTMSFLDQAVCILSGPIDAAADDGVGWRKEFTNRSMAFELNLRILDPTDKPVGGHNEIGEEKRHTFELRAQGKFDEVGKIVKTFRYQDLRMVDLSDFMVVLIDPAIHHCGTYEELYRAKAQRKPIFGIIKGGRTHTPLWLLDGDVISLENLFDSVEDCVARLNLINKGYYWVDKDQWVFARDFLGDK